MLIAGSTTLSLWGEHCAHEKIYYPYDSIHVVFCHVRLEQQRDLIEECIHHTGEFGFGWHSGAVRPHEPFVHPNW